MTHTETSLTAAAVQLVLTAASAPAPEGTHAGGWADGAFDLPSVEGMELAPAYWVARLTAEAAAWGAPESSVRRPQEAYAPGRPESYYQARASRSMLVATALRTQLEAAEKVISTPAG